MYTFQVRLHNPIEFTVNSRFIWHFIHTNTHTMNCAVKISCTQRFPWNALTLNTNKRDTKLQKHNRTSIACRWSWIISYYFIIDNLIVIVNFVLQTKRIFNWKLAIVDTFYKKTEKNQRETFVLWCIIVFVQFCSCQKKDQQKIKSGLLYTHLKNKQGGQNGTLSSICIWITFHSNAIFHLNR